MGLFKKFKKESNSCCCGNVDSLIIKEDVQKDQGCGCSNDKCCSDNDNCCSNNDTCCSDNDNCCSENDNCCKENSTPKAVIKILGSGCKNCITLTQNVNTALEEMKLDAQVIKVTDIAEITAYGVMTTPALVVNEKVVSYGKVLKPNDVVKIFEKIF